MERNILSWIYKSINGAKISKEKVHNEVLETIKNI